MSKGLKFFGVLLGVPALIIGLFYINTAVYPFQSKHPNYADVEQSFAKLRFPTDWQEISSSENRGVAGRQCDPFDSSGCFSKSKTFKLPPTAGEEHMKKAFTEAGCESVSQTDITQEGETNKSYSLRCNIGTAGVYLIGSYRGAKGEAYMAATTY